MRTATPAITQYVELPTAASAAGVGSAPMSTTQAGARKARAAASARSVNYSSSPLLASKTPLWRSKFIVALRRPRLRACWLGRAAYVQVVGNDFFQQPGRGPLRAHAGAAGQPRPHPRPQRPDPRLQRAGAVSIWAIPKDVERDARKLRAARQAARA